MDEETLLPNSEYIDISLGLKYLNANRKLYLKVLNSFLTRYEGFDIERIEKNEFKNTMHTLKGLASTLGMVSLSRLAEHLQKNQNKELLFEFSKTLKIIISDLNATQLKTLVIIDDNSNDIDSLIEMLGDSYDVMVITSPSSTLEELKSENINIVLLNPALSNPQIQKILEQKRVSIIELHKPIKLNSLQKSIKSVQK